MGRVLDEVLALVIDSAIELSGAERGFIMLADAGNALEFKLARGRDKVTLPGETFETSRKFPEEVFATGEPRVGVNLLDDELSSEHGGTDRARHPARVLRAPAPRAVRQSGGRGGRGEADRRAVPGQPGEGGAATSSGRAAVETLATEAAVAIATPTCTVSRRRRPA